MPADRRICEEEDYSLEIPSREPVRPAPSWKNPPRMRLPLGNLNLTDEVLADRDDEQ
jgi:hypothetical protein